MGRWCSTSRALGTMRVCGSWRRCPKCESADGGLVLRIDRVEGELKTVRVGDTVPANGSGQAGQQVFSLYDEGQYISSASELTIRGGQVYCQVNRDTAKRPVTIDTAIDAMRSEPAACVEVLANDDSLWNRSQCEGGSGLGGDVVNEGARDSGSGGCGLAPATFAGAELTSAALFAALWARRWRQR